MNSNTPEDLNIQTLKQLFLIIKLPF